MLFVSTLLYASFSEILQGGGPFLLQQVRGGKNHIKKTKGNNLIGHFPS